MTTSRRPLPLLRFVLPVVQMAVLVCVATSAQTAHAAPQTGTIAQTAADVASVPQTGTTAQTAADAASVPQTGTTAQTAADVAAAPQIGTASQTAPAGSAVTLTLDKAIAMALGRNRDVQVADQERHKAAARVSEARSGVLPQLMFIGQYSRNIQKPVIFLAPNTPINPSSTTEVLELGSNNSFLGGLQLSQILFNRKVGAALAIAKTYKSYAGEAFRAAEQSVVLDVKKAFYGVLLAQKLMDANREGLDVAKANLENVRALYQHGSAAEFDLIRAQVQVANTEPLSISAENNLVLAKNGLKNLLAIPQDQDIQVQGEFAFAEFPQSMIDDADQAALSENPIIAQLKFQESILAKNVTVGRSDYFPTLILVGSYLWQTEDNSFNFSNYLWAKTLNVGVQLSYPFFDGFSTKSRVRQAILDREKLHYTRLKAEEGLRLQIQSAELKMAEAKKRIAGQQESVKQAEKAVQIAQTRFKSGVGTHLELLDTQVAMTLAQTNHANAIYDYLVAQAEWEYAVGRIK